VPRCAPEAASCTSSKRSGAAAYAELRARALTTDLDGIAVAIVASTT